MRGKRANMYFRRVIIRTSQSVALARRKDVLSVLDCPRAVGSARIEIVSEEISTGLSDVPGLRSALCGQVEMYNSRQLIGR